MRQAAEQVHGAKFFAIHNLNPRAWVPLPAIAASAPSWLESHRLASPSLALSFSVSGIPAVQLAARHDIHIAELERFGEKVPSSSPVRSVVLSLLDRGKTLKVSALLPCSIGEQVAEGWVLT